MSGQDQKQSGSSFEERNMLSGEDPDQPGISFEERNLTDGLPVRIADNAASLITLLFHPIVLPIYGLLLIFNVPALLSFLPGPARRIIFTMVLVNTVILPIAILPLLKLRNVISSYRLETRGERIIPLLMTSLMYFVTAFMMFRLQLPLLIKEYVFAASCVVLATALLNFRRKISVHAVGAGAMVATVMILSFRMLTVNVWVLVITLIVSGLVMTSRLWLRAHTPAEVYSGFVTGFIVMIAGMLI
jgi:hypothetical protein